MSPVGPSAELRARVLAAARADAAVPRPAGLRRRASFVVTAAAAWASVAALALRPGLGGRPVGLVLGSSLAWLLCGAAATWAGVARGRSMLGRPKAVRLAVALLTPVLLLASALAVTVAFPPASPEGAVARSHVVCFLGTLAFAVGPLVAFAVLWRESDPVSPKHTGAALGAAAGAWGALGIVLHCGRTAVEHVALGHVLPVAVLAAVGAILGRRVLAVRGRLG